MQTLLHSKRLTFKQWIRLEEIREDAQKAAESGADDFPDFVYSYLSAALGVPAEFFENWTWADVFRAYTEVFTYQVLDLPLPILNPSNTSSKELPLWHYKGRTWNYYSHLISKEYGWTLEYVENLSPTEALAHIQEILTDEQLRKEFEWSLSDIAYPYNKSTRKSEFKPLQRPYWMLPKIEQPKKIKMRKDFIPVGNIIEIGKHREEKAEPANP